MTEYIDIALSDLVLLAKYILGIFFLSLFSVWQGGYTYVTVSNLPSRRQPHSVFMAFVHAGTICLFLDP